MEDRFYTYYSSIDIINRNIYDFCNQPERLEEGGNRVIKFVNY